jgi:1-acyl-sn-glycerol-3-phosphate acyltransferase
MAEPFLGPTLRLLNRFYPVEALLDIAGHLDPRIASEGLAAASRWLLDAHVIHWTSNLPPATREVLASEPALIYGNHPSMLTAFLVAAHVERPDLRILSASYMLRLLPSYAAYAIPIELPPDQGWEQLRRGGLQRIVAARLIGLLQEAVPREGAKEANRRALTSAVEHILRGGCVLIAPGGGSKRHSPWHPGIGHIVKSLAEEPGERGAYLVPFRESCSSDDRVRAILGSGPVARLKRRVVYRKPVGIQFAEPRTVSALGPLPEQVPELVRLLREHYDGLFAPR